jgi:mono/diheme cytochrome c family protein
MLSVLRSRVSKCPRSGHNSDLKRLTSISLLLLFLFLLAGCGKDREKMTDSELGLNTQESRGRRLYVVHCQICHPAYSSHGNKGPGLKDLYKKQYLPSGLTPTDEHVEQSVIHGRNMMPGFGDAIDQQQLQDLMAYLHTL